MWQRRANEIGGGMRATRYLRLLIVLALGMAVPVVAGSPASAASPFDYAISTSANGPTPRLDFFHPGMTITANVMLMAGQHVEIATASGTFVNQCDLRMIIRAPDTSQIVGPVCAGRSAHINNSTLPADGNYTIAL